MFFNFASVKYIVLNKIHLKLLLDLDFLLIAVTASLKDYTFCHKVNNALGFEFVKTEDHAVYFNVDEAPLQFSCYYYFLEQGEIEYYVLANRNSEGLLVPEMSNVDYFIVVRPFLCKDDLEFMLARINKIAEVQVAAKIDAHKLKSKQNLII